MERHNDGDENDEIDKIRGSKIVDLYVVFLLFFIFSLSLLFIYNIFFSFSFSLSHIWHLVKWYNTISILVMLLQYIVRFCKHKHSLWKIYFIPLHIFHVFLAINYGYTSIFCCCCCLECLNILKFSVFFVIFWWMPQVIFPYFCS